MMPKKRRQKTVEVRNTRASRTLFLTIIALVFLGFVVLGFVFLSIANSYPYYPGVPDNPTADFFWYAGCVLIGAGIIGEIVVIVIAIVIAARTARANANLRRLRGQLINTREEERRRLRRDLHDGLGPLLASLTLTLTAARKLLRDDPDAAEILLADATAHAQEAITDIRRLVYALRPPTLDDLGLVAAICEEFDQYRTSGVAFKLDTPEQLPPLSAAVEVACYRIAQEALTNVVRHAQAHTCMVRFVLGKMLTLEITDDGIGLPTKHKAGVGLNSMHERTEELGGMCIIEPVSGGGTRVYAQLPLS
jgi:signal transduction histidine kinase